MNEIISHETRRVVNHPATRFIISYRESPTEYETDASEETNVYEQEFYSCSRRKNIFGGGARPKKRVSH